MKRWREFWQWRFPASLGLALSVAALIAAPAAAAALSQGYKTSETLPAGSIVGLDPDNNGYVRSSNTERTQELLGVVVASNDTLLSVSGGGTTVQVVSDGVVNTLVSNINGDIKKGDPIAASPLSGIGMKATLATRILGFAQDDFSASSPTAVSKSVASKTGPATVAIGQIGVQILAGNYTPRAANAFVPQSIQNLANWLAGKPVPVPRVVIGALLLVLGVVLSVVILNGAIRSSMESIGRNPLARSVIGRSLLKVLVLNLAILLITLASVYLVVKG